MGNDIHIEYLSNDVLRDLKQRGGGAKPGIVDQNRGISVFRTELFRSGMYLLAGGYVDFVEDTIRF